MKPAGRKALASFEDLAESLEPLKTKTDVPNPDFIGWPGGFPNIERFLGSLRSDPADYVFATLAPGTSDDALEVFAAADISAIVTHPGHSVDKVFEFLQRLASRGSVRRDVYILLNQVRRGGEERDTAVLAERARTELGLNVSVLGTAVYDSQTAAGFRHGASLAAFEDIALKIERLLPRATAMAAVPESEVHGKGRGGGMLAAVMSPFGRKRRKLEENLRQRDQTIGTLQRRHESMVDDLQEMLKQKNDEIGEKATLIDALEDDFLHVSSDFQVVHADPPDDPLGIDDVCGSQRNPVLAVQNSERLRQFLFVVGEHRIPKFLEIRVILPPCKVHKLAVGAAAQDHGVPVFESA